MITHLRGISFLVMGSYPTQATLAFSQLAQLGSFWSHLFLRRRQRLQALTLRKLLLWPTLALPPSCFVLPARPALSGAPSPCCSLVAGDGPEVATLREGGESLSDRRSGEDCRNRLAGCICGEGREFSGILLRCDGRIPVRVVFGAEADASKRSWFLFLLFQPASIPGQRPASLSTWTRTRTRAWTRMMAMAGWFT